MNKVFNIHHQWKLFLDRCNVKEEMLPEDQKREMKRAFYGGVGQTLILLRDELADFSEKIGGVKGEIAAAAILETMLNQVSSFWETESLKQGL